LIFFGGRYTLVHNVILLDQFRQSASVCHSACPWQVSEHCENGERPMITMGSLQEVTIPGTQGLISNPLRPPLPQNWGLTTHSQNLHRKSRPNSVRYNGGLHWVTAYGNKNRPTQQYHRRPLHPFPQKGVIKNYIQNNSKPLQHPNRYLRALNTRPIGTRSHHDAHRHMGTPSPNLRTAAL